jgi:hypothetical protein
MNPYLIFTKAWDAQKTALFRSDSNPDPLKLAEGLEKSRQEKVNRFPCFEFNDLVYQSGEGAESDLSLVPRLQ